MKRKKTRYSIIAKEYFFTLSIIILIGVLTTTMIRLPYYAIKNDEIDKDVFSRYETKNSQEKKVRSDCILVLGDDNGVDDDIIKKSLDDARLSYDVKKDFSEINNDELEKAEVIIIDGDDFDRIGMLSDLIPMLNQKTKVIFTSIPSLEYAEIIKFNEYTGIRQLEKVISHKGITLVSGFMVGGLLELPDFSYSANKVKLLSTTKRYAISDENQDAIIWRNTYDGIEYYTVNGDFFNSSLGLGIMSALFAQVYTDYIYPIINSMDLTYSNFPYFIDDENMELLYEIYNRNAVQLQNDILVPDIVSINKSRHMVPSGFATYSLKSNEESYFTENDKQNIMDGMNDLWELGGEVGMTYSGDINADKVNFEKLFDKNELNSICIDKSNSENFDSLFTNQDFSIVDGIYGHWTGQMKVFEFISENTVYIPFTLEGAYISDYDKFNVFSCGTMYGVIIHNIDFNNVVHPNTNEDQWQNISREYARSVDFYRSIFDGFRKLNIIETTSEVKKYANNYANIIQTGNTIDIIFEKYLGECYYFLRTAKDITNIVGGEAEEVEEDIYIITTKSKEIKITLE